MSVKGILNSKTLHELVCAVEEFCQKNLIRENDDICMDLKKQLHTSTENDYLTLLLSYVAVAEDGDEVIEALYEFIEICKGFVEEDEGMTHQITKGEFEAVLDECQDKCVLLECLNVENTLNIIEIPYYAHRIENCIQIKNDVVNVLLPKIDMTKNIKEYIAEEIGIVLYNVFLKKWNDEYIRQEMNRYIPETRIETDVATIELFKKYFYGVVLYKERSPGIYLELDEHMKRVLLLGFFRHIINHYMSQCGNNDKEEHSKISMKA